MRDSTPGQARVQGLLMDVLANPLRLLTMPADDLDLTLRAGRRARVLGRLAESLKVADRLQELPVVARDQLVSASTLAAARARLARWELDRIAWAMRDKPDAPLVVMKGCAYLLLGLPNAAGRVFADVDLLTEEAQLPDVEVVLNQAGWPTAELSPYDQNYYRVWTHELPPLTHREREVEIDLHHNIVPRTGRLKPDGEKLLARSRPLPNTSYRVLSNEDLLLHTMTHLMFDADLADQLRDLVDIEMMAAHFSRADPEFWPRFCERAVELDLTRPAYYSLRYAERLLQADIPDAVREHMQRWAPIAPIRRLMDAMVPRALIPQHPDRAERLSGLSRFVLYLRSHWIRMPPWLLAYHLTYKFLVTRFSGRSKAADT